MHRAQSRKKKVFFLVPLLMLSTVLILSFTNCGQFQPSITGGAISQSSSANPTPSIYVTVTPSVSPAPIPSPVVTPSPVPGAKRTWYIRPDGGDRAQCTGLADASYSGSGTNQSCALKHPYYLVTDNTSSAVFKWIISAGDSVIIKSGSYRMGQSAAGAGTNWLACASSPTTCFLPAVPSGTASAHTRILGANWGACSSGTKPELWGAQGAQTLLDLRGSQYVDVQCLEITDHAACGLSGTSDQKCQKTSLPYDDFAYTGIRIAESTHILLQDLDIHGLASEGINGNPHYADFVRVHVAGNPAAGIDFDPTSFGAPAGPVTGTILLSYVDVEWNGCIEQYPTKGLYGSCNDQNSGGWGDGAGPSTSGGDWIVDHSKFSNNTQDGLDLLYVKNPGATISITNSIAYGNMGNQFKLGPASRVVFQNNIVIGDCKTGMSVAHPGVATSTYTKNLSLYCRGAGSPVVQVLLPGSHNAIQNNSITGESDVLVGLSCSDSTCGATTSVNFDNNIVFGFNRASNSSRLPVGIYDLSVNNFLANSGGSRRNNLFFNLEDACAPAGSVSELCVDPKLTSATNIESVNFHLLSASPAINGGVTISGLVTDFDGVARPQNGLFDIGALEFH